MATQEPKRLQATRRLLRTMTHAAYDLEVTGLQHVPQSGPALIVSNHVSYADSLILAGLLERSPRFLVYYKIHDHPAMRWFFEMVRSIPIAGTREDPVRMETALATAAQALRNGDILGIFPEGELTHTGEISAFRPGVERILAESPAPVVPMAIQGLWGSTLSRGSQGRWPRLRRRRVRLSFAAPMAPAGLTAAAMEAKVRALRGHRR